MTAFAWRTFLQQFSRELLASREIRPTLAPDVVASGWLGFEPASAAELAALEQRLGTALPPSYKNFLAASNGWRHPGSFIDRLFPCAEVAWFRTDHQQWIDAYTEPAQNDPPVSIEEHCRYGDDQDSFVFRPEYLSSALQISAVGDSAVYLLNPEIQTPDGEWEAWFFANWLPGASRYRSFRELLEAECESFIRLRDDAERRFFPEDGLETLPAKLPDLIQLLQEKADEHSRLQAVRAPEIAAEDEAYTAGLINGLNAIVKFVRGIEARQLAPQELLTRLTELEAESRQLWKQHARPGYYIRTEQSGAIEAMSQAADIIHWFLNQPDA